MAGPTVESYDSFTGAGISRDADTNFPVFAPIADKSPQTVLDTWVEEYPGTVQQHSGPELVYCDNGDVYEKIKKHKKDRTYIKERQIWKILI